MDGIQLMTQVCQRHPHISRIIISGLGDQEEIARGLNTTHQFLTKPVKLGELLATLERIGDLDAYLQDEKLRALAGKLDSLPSFPSAYLQIMQEINSEEPSVEAIADIVVKDPALTAKMLQVANSAAFGLAQKVSNPFEAVQFLGITTVRSITLSAHVFSSFGQVGLRGFSATQLWDDALHCARITRTIMQAEKAGETQIQDACTAALLRNTGQLMLAVNFPAEFRKAVTQANMQHLPLPTVEQEIMGATHSGVAAYLFGLWGLTAPMVEAVAFHLEPGRSSVRAFSPLTAVHVAHVLSQEQSRRQGPGRPAEIDHDYLAAIGAASRLDHWRSESEKLSARDTQAA
jgi:HD-like signal output (HDOD) protein